MMHSATILEELDLPILKQIEPQKVKIILEMILKGVNCPPDFEPGAPV